MSKRGLTTLTYRELSERQFPERDLIIEPFLRSGETMMVWGPTGIGKTQFILSLAIAIASGGTVGEWCCPQPKKVLLIDGEMHLQDIGNRIESLTDTEAVRPGCRRSVWDENLTILSRQDQNPDVPFLDLTDPESHQQTRELCETHNVDVLIIDNFTTLTDGLEDENDATAFKGTQGFFLNMKQAGVTTLLVHHARKDGREYRGSQSLSVTFEVILALLKPAAEVPSRASFVLEFQKFRAKGDQSLAPKEWTLDPDEGWRITEEVGRGDKIDRMVDLVRSLDFTSQTEIADRLGCHKSTVSRDLKRAEALGKLKEGEAGELFQAAADIRSGDQALEKDEVDDDF